jgi:hypothetical protein
VGTGIGLRGRWSMQIVRGEEGRACKPPDQASRESSGVWSGLWQVPEWRAAGQSRGRKEGPSGGRRWGEAGRHAQAKGRYKPAAHDSKKGVKYWLLIFS